MSRPGRAGCPGTVSDGLLTIRCGPSIWRAGFAARRRASATSPRCRASSPRKDCFRRRAIGEGRSQARGDHRAVGLRPVVLNTPSGIVDLPAARSDHIDRKTTSKIPALRRSRVPTWRAFLHRVTSGDAELIALCNVRRLRLDRLDPRTCARFPLRHRRQWQEHVSSIRSPAHSDYHRRRQSRRSPPATWSGIRPTSLDCAGARLVTATETEEGRRWAESKIKALTGGDKIAARFMRQDYFEFIPQFKLLIAGNHKPGLRSVDEAIRRRFHLVPFTVTIPPAERDETLTEAQSGMARHLVVGDRGLCRMAAAWPSAARSGDRSNSRLHAGPGCCRRMDR